MSKTPEDLLNKVETVFGIERGQNRGTISGVSVSSVEALKDPKHFVFKFKIEEKDPEENVVPFKDIKKH